MNYFSMFSGIGGFERGIQNATKNQWECVGYSEIDKYAIQVYSKHFPTHKNWGDATKINPSELPQFDLLVGGFPCQSFSIAGKRKGFEDTRGTLFFEIARILKTKRPRICLLENVKGLVNHDKGRTFATIISTLSELGYNVEWQVLNSKFFGVPQNRERVFIVGRLGKGSSIKIFPLGQISQGVDDREEGVSTDETSQEGRDSINPDGRILEDKEGRNIFGGIQQMNNPSHSNNRVYSKEGISPSLNTMQGGNRQPKIISHSPRTGEPKKGGTGPLSSEEHCFIIDSTPHLVIPCLTPDRLEKRQNGRRFKENGEPSFTLTGQDIQGISDGTNIRRLTPIECARLQGFDDSWCAELSDTQQYKCYGNAVTTNVIEAIIKRMFLHD